MHELGDTSVANFLEPHASWDSELISFDVEVDIWYLFILLFSAIASCKSVWHYPAFHSFALYMLFHNWVEVFIWDHVQWSSSISHNSSNISMERFSTDFNVTEVKLPKYWVGNFVELKITWSKFSGVISSKSNFALTLRVNVHGKEISFNGSLLVKGWNKQLRSSILTWWS